MEVVALIQRQLRINKGFAVTFISVLVSATGAYIIATTLIEQVIVLKHGRISSLDVDIPLLVGLSIIYLGTLLKRQKRTAWMVTLCATVFYLLLSASQFLSHLAGSRLWGIELVRGIILPLIIILLLVLFRKDFVVKSDIQGFHFAVRFSVLILLVAVIYGVAGFELLDKTDFHQEIGWVTGLHYTVDQFNITTDKPIHPYTRRAKIFVDSLSFVSTISVLYVVFALFQPFRARFTEQGAYRDHLELLLEKYGGESEEFFKLWPHDKQYFFDETGQSGLAFHVYRGVALCIGDPIGDKSRYSSLLSDFNNLCFHNDWVPSMIHVSENHLGLYEKHGFAMQKLGQEAVVDIEHFENELKTSKYFRQILNRFNKHGYTYELLSPPHHDAVIDRLKSVSDEWLGKGGRSERGLAMGYFTNEYLQMCKIAVARDAANTIQAFANIVPAHFNQTDATYDMLRQGNKALSNINDFLLMNLIEELHKDGYKTLNMGLSPLAGLNDDESKTILDNVLKFAYNNGDMFYSFSGLHRFKSKYEPKWQDKYVGYKGGLRGFSRTMTALTRSMSKVVKS